jgi:hypothetical protein
MHKHQFRVFLPVFLLVLGIAGSSSNFASSPKIVGWVVTSLNASIGGTPVAKGQTIISGQQLDVGREGKVLLELGTGSRMLLGENTVVSFERQANQVNALVSRGEVGISQPKDPAIQVRVKYGKTVVSPALGSYTSGKVVVTKQLVSVETTAGSLRLEGNGQVLDVPGGREAMLTKDSAQSAAGLKAVALHQTLGAAGSERSFMGEPPEDFDCDKDDRTLSPHKPPKCQHENDSHGDSHDGSHED